MPHPGQSRGGSLSEPQNHLVFTAKDAKSAKGMQEKRNRRCTQMNADKKQLGKCREFLLSASISVHLRFQNLLYSLALLASLAVNLLRSQFNPPATPACPSAQIAARPPATAP